MFEADSGTSSPLLRSYPSASPFPSTKRKRDPDDQVDPSHKKKTPTRKKAKKAKPSENEDLDLENGVNNAIGMMDPRLLADYVAQRMNRFGGELSLMELEDKHIPERAFRDTSGFQQRRMIHHLPEYLEQFASREGQSKNLSTASKKPGTPHTIVITSAGLRAADVTRALRTFQTKQATVAKLFAKHIKLKEAIEFVRKTRMGIGVGTPSRLIDLIDAGALSLDKIERIIVDGSHIDQKKRGILDMKETHGPLMHLLNRPELKERYGAGNDGGVDLLFY